jgi:hypothetical protein
MIKDNIKDNNINKNIKNDNNKNDNNKNIKNIKIIKNIKNKDKDYVKPIITYTDKLTEDKIKELLYDYEQIDDNNKIKILNDTPQNTHIRYFENKNNILKFRTGGILTVKTGLPDYIILSNGKLSWSVQVNSCIFFKRITIKQIKEEYKNLLLEKEAIIIGNQKIIQEQSKEIKNLKKILSKYINKNK